MPNLCVCRYDGRGALGDLRIYEPPTGGFDLRTILTEDELKVEQLCDEERYKSLYNNDAEEAICHEEEMKRLHQALDSENTYSQVGYNYQEENSQKGEESQSPKQSEGSQEEEDQAFVVPPELNVPEGMILPETHKLNAIITKTALFISRQGGQMEILIKAKQANNPQFAFLSIDGELHPYYRHVLEAIKSGKYNPEKKPEKEESDDGEESEGDDEPYLHPSLVSSLTKVEAAPSIPSIQYKPSADCAYSMLVNKITGKPPPSRMPPQSDVPMQPLITPGYYHPAAAQAYMAYPPAPQQYSHGPVIYGQNGQTQSPPNPQMASAPSSSVEVVAPHLQQKELLTPLVPYGTSYQKPLSRPSFIVPPADVQIIIDKMASYVAKNGRDFEAIVKNKGDPRFNFLELSHQYHGYYAHKLTLYEGAFNAKVLTEEELLQKQEPQEEKQKKLEELHKKQQRMEEVQKRVKMIQAKKKGDAKGKQQGGGKQVTTVSFSIKKPKEGEAGVIEKRSALPLEESEDEGEEEKREAGSKPNSPPECLEEARDSREKEPPRTERRAKIEEKELVDLTDDILEDWQKEARNRQAEDRIKDKLAAAARDKMAASARDKMAAVSRERQLQLERKKKAAMFLSQIQAPNLNKIPSSGLNPRPRAEEEEDEVQSLPSPTPEEIEEEARGGSNSLMSRLKSADLSGKRSRPRSRSSSRSRSHSDRHKQHKKHKKKKSAHKSYESPSSNRPHKSKKSKKSSSRHKSRSRSPLHRHRQSSKHSRKSSHSSDSGSSSS
ncbi:splicing factor, suppressor of white-apricot homolog isoform X2 [Orussus abietinus]|uniref:splicing factor, suppressor of white-apricot homolog isoform X2 n=1 Tax=Orussus abietinus TaxID=222816 RepID=UPI000C715ECF|nr:splicing factor, suppressor of white-apricot homolog isoform X2 [Orussus abietinus]XP_023288290.1 splicing factor, suppressor of white-apricot homolog isoform X2 [Orussus abietinus]XP_023288291.1 splicing factor, suppressor of white-apricot homolog isoform X2 [Orussus abietinus]